MASKIPEGTRRSAKIEHFIVTPDEARLNNFRVMSRGHPSMMIDPGRYTRLFVDDDLMMSDTRMEKDSNRRLIEVARGHVLIGGLGLGMVIWPLLSKHPALRSLLVLEKNPDVIELVRPHLSTDSRLEVMKADVFRWKPLKMWPRFDTIYFDIWPNICETNVMEAARLRERAQAWVSAGGWIGDWDTEVRCLEVRKYH